MPNQSRACPTRYSTCPRIQSFHRLTGPASPGKHVRPQGHSRPATGYPARLAAVPATPMPVPAIVLTAIGGPGDDMGYAGGDFVITARTAICLDCPTTWDGPDGVEVVTVRSRLGTSEDVAEPTARGRTRAAVGARLPTRHALSLSLDRTRSLRPSGSIGAIGRLLRLRRGGIRCSRCRVGRCNRGSGIEFRGPRRAYGPAA